MSRKGYFIIKRAFDIIVSLFAILILSPIALIVFLIVAVGDVKSTVLFKQERIGKNASPFYIYKFRTMRADAEESGPALCHCDGNGNPVDVRLTVCGRFLRRYHLDELPNFWNVLIGDMSLVGPRPERKYYVDKIMERNPRYAELFQIRPGLTSNATICNGYTDSMEKMLVRLDSDLQYMREMSMTTDLLIIVKTVKYLTRISTAKCID